MPFCVVEPGDRDNMIWWGVLCGSPNISGSDGCLSAVSCQLSALSQYSDSHLSMSIASEQPGGKHHHIVMQPE